MSIRFHGRVLVLGCGAVSQCLQPLLLRHFEMDFRELVVMDFTDVRAKIAPTLTAGARYVRHRVTPDNVAETLAQWLRPGDLLVNLTWDVDSLTLVDWCRAHGVLYLDTSVETWDSTALHQQDRTVGTRHARLRARTAHWPRNGPTAVNEHGANPGLVSHWTKVALEDVATAMLPDLDGPRRDRLSDALAAGDYAGLAWETGTKAVHISERDTQITCRPKQVGEFVNTWSPKGFHEEGTAPAELAWGTHEYGLPGRLQDNMMWLESCGFDTLVRSWVPSTGPLLGMLIPHSETDTISRFLTVWRDDVPVYRPTVLFAYLPSDAALASAHECRMRDHRLQSRQRLMGDDIVDGMDEVGVLLLGHDLTAWWVGSQLTIHDARSSVPHQNATTLQVAASVLGALHWMLRNPDRGLCTPEDLDHREVLAVAEPYLGKCLSVRADWTVGCQLNEVLHIPKIH